MEREGFSASTKVTSLCQCSSCRGLIKLFVMFFVGWLVLSSFYLDMRLRMLSIDGQEGVAKVTTSEIHAKNVKVRIKNGWYRACTQNPYAAAFTDSLDVLVGRADTWLENINKSYQRASDINLLDHTHARFFPFDTLAPCKAQAWTCIGGACTSDQSKFICGLHELSHMGQNRSTSGSPAASNCIVYSIGRNNNWDFELDLLKNSPCTIHTFDCRGPKSRFMKPDNDRLHFHHVCLGVENKKVESEDFKSCDVNKKCGETWTLMEIHQRLGHTQIDLLKIDIEGFEWDLIESWPLLTDHESSIFILPMQLLVEIHYRTSVPELYSEEFDDEVTRHDFKLPSDMVDLQSRFLQMGYMVAKRNDNPLCLHCTELTLVRTRCPDTGVYTNITVNNNDLVAEPPSRQSRNSPSRAPKGNNLPGQFVGKRNSNLPDWMKEYFSWHQQQVALLNETNWQDHRFLVMQCLRSHGCGGTSDRIHQIPLLIRYAAQLRRILFIKWEKPHPLEAFLRPPAGGLDWRFPLWLDEKFDLSKGILGDVPTQDPADVALIHIVNNFGATHGQKQYDTLKAADEPSFDQIYHDCWDAVFEPVPPIQTLIEDNMRVLGLNRGNYSSVHIRSKYLENQEDMQFMIENAVNCASSLRPGHPIFVASDSNVTIQKAVEYGSSKGGTIVARIGGSPLHLDLGQDFLGSNTTIVSYPAAEAYYDTFVDLYLLKYSECIAIGGGGYGLWANRLSEHIDCVRRHNTHYDGGEKGIIKCEWHNKTSTI